MFITTINKNHHIDAYGIKCQLLNPKIDQSKSAINTTHCIVSPNKQTKNHSHREVEQFFILSGKGEFILEDEKFTVGAGQLITIPPFKNHVIKNKSSVEDLVFLSSYSDFVQVAQKKPIQSVIAAPPTPNGDLHLGHLGGPYIVSDIYKRYLVMKNLDALSFSGTDDYQNYIVQQAKKELNKPEQIITKYRTKICSALNKTNVDFDKFISPVSEKNYKEFVRSFYERLLNNNFLEVKDIPTFIDEQGSVVLESEIKGECPSCNKKVAGNCCESCGYVGDVATILNPSHINDKKIYSKDIKRVALNLSQFKSMFIDYTNNVAEGSFLRKTFLPLLEKINFYPVSYPSDWGVEVEVLNSDYPKQVINVWVEMAASYVLESQTSGRKFFSSSESETTLFCGVDNLFYYAVLIPMLLRMYDSENINPYEIKFNRFLLLDGEKFSTSRNHAIWANDFLEEQDPDFVRLFLAYRRANEHEQNISQLLFENFLEVLNIRGLDMLMKRLKTESFDSSNICSSDVISEMSELLINYERHFTRSDLGFRQNAEMIISLINRCEELKGSDFLIGMRVLASIMYPFMPNRGKEIFSIFSETHRGYWIEDLSPELSMELISKKGLIYEH